MRACTSGKNNCAAGTHTCLRFLYLADGGVRTVELSHGADAVVPVPFLILELVAVGRCQKQPGMEGAQ